MKIKIYTMIGAFMLATGLACAAVAEDQSAMIEAALAGGDAAAGEKVFKKCKACHMVGDGAKNRTGPILNNIIGAAMGVGEDFKYSKAMAERTEAGDIWTLENLDVFLTKPRNFLNKTKMSFAGLKKPEQRADLIAYLATFSTTE